jgi:hypothetical protein
MLKFILLKNVTIISDTKSENPRDENILLNKTSGMKIN